MLQKLKLWSGLIVCAVLLCGAGSATVSAATDTQGGGGTPSGTGTNSGCGKSLAPVGYDCSTIPLGCPGSSLQGPVPQSTKLVCPFSPVGGFKCPTVSCKFLDADTTPSTQIGGDCRDISKCDLIQEYINPAINLLAALVGIIVVVSIVIGGIQYSTSGGDSQKASAARARIRNAVIALITFMLLYAGLNFLLPGGLV